MLGFDKRKRPAAHREGRNKKRAESRSKKNGKNWDVGAGRLIGRFFFCCCCADVVRNIRRRWRRMLLSTIGSARCLFSSQVCQQSKWQQRKNEKGQTRNNNKHSTL
jgi:hypothetical protein